jgi:hypothetical protein
MTTIGESISRVRGIIKGTNEDSFLTDRFVYSIISKYAKMILRRQQNEKKLMGHDDLFELLPFVDLIPVSKIEADCIDIPSKCIIMRTRKKLPKLFNGNKGPLIRKVYSIDGSDEFVQTSPTAFISLTKLTTFKYNKTKYFWYRNGYLYFPNTDIEGVMIEGLWEDLLDGFCITEQDCMVMQDRKLPLPEYFFAEVEQMAEQEFGVTMRIPNDGADNSQNALR